jgi:predicted ATP-dependent protease
VTYKIEGYFDLCKKRGLTGAQGVIIPKRNIKDLVLKDEVIEAVKAGQFHIYPICSVDEGIEILTRLPAGAVSGNAGKKEGSRYSFDSVHGKVYRRLRSFYKRAMKGLE